MAAGTTSKPRKPPEIRASAHLRLVHSAPAATERRARDHAPLSPSAKLLRRSVLRSAMQQGALINADALAAILAAKSSVHHVPLMLFTEDIVWQILWVDVVSWCTHRHVPVPDQVAETLWFLLTHLDATDQLIPGSDPLTFLQSPLMAAGGLGKNGKARHPAGRRNG